MTYQAYLDNIRAKTGKTPKDFVAMAKKKGFLNPDVKAGEIVTWLKQDFGLGHGHAMAIVLLLRQSSSPRPSADERLDKLFSGARAGWRKPYDALVAKAKNFGPGVTVSPTDTYISLLHGGKKFAVVQVTADRMDIGIKRKGIPTKGRFTEAGAWNQMVTHRVQIGDPKQIDAEVISWLRQAYEQV